MNTHQRRRSARVFQLTCLGLLAGAAAVVACSQGPVTHPSDELAANSFSPPNAYGVIDTGVPRLLRSGLAANTQIAGVNAPATISGQAPPVISAQELTQPTCGTPTTAACAASPQPASQPTCGTPTTAACSSASASANAGATTAAGPSANAAANAFSSATSAGGSAAGVPVPTTAAQGAAAVAADPFLAPGATRGSCRNQGLSASEAADLASDGGFKTLGDAGAIDGQWHFYGMPTVQDGMKIKAILNPEDCSLPRYQVSFMWTAAPTGEYYLNLTNLDSGIHGNVNAVLTGALTAEKVVVNSAGSANGGAFNANEVLALQDFASAALTALHTATPAPLGTVNWHPEDAFQAEVNCGADLAAFFPSIVCESLNLDPARTHKLDCSSTVTPDWVCRLNRSKQMCVGKNVLIASPGSQVCKPGATMPTTPADPSGPADAPAAPKTPSASSAPDASSAKPAQTCTCPIGYPPPNAQGVCMVGRIAQRPICH